MGRECRSPQGKSCSRSGPISRKLLSADYDMRSSAARSGPYSGRRPTRPPRPADERLFTGRMIVWSMIQAGWLSRFAAWSCSDPSPAAMPVAKRGRGPSSPSSPPSSPLSSPTAPSEHRWGRRCAVAAGALRRVGVAVARVSAVILLVPRLRATSRFDALDLGQIARAAVAGGVLLLLLGQLKRLTLNPGR